MKKFLRLAIESGADECISHKENPWNSMCNEWNL